MKEFKHYITNCFECPYFHINPPIVKEAYRCDLGAKEMPSLWEREDKVANDCPLPDTNKEK